MLIYILTVHAYAFLGPPIRIVFFFIALERPDSLIGEVRDQNFLNIGLVTGKSALGIRSEAGSPKYV